MRFKSKWTQTAEPIKRTFPLTRLWRREDTRKLRYDETMQHRFDHLVGSNPLLLEVTKMESGA